MNHWSSAVGRSARRAGRSVILCLLIGVGLSASLPAQDGGTDWPQWRGPSATGSAPGGMPPTEWSESQNIRWKVAIPGNGSASPLVSGDKVFVFTATETGEGSGVASGGLFTRLRRRFTGGTTAEGIQRYHVLALSRSDGRVLWDRVATEALPHEGRHQTGTWASPSGVADHDQVCAFFGSAGLYCYDHDGTLLWERDLGDLEIRMEFGEGASPVLHDNSIVVNWDHQGQSFITALDKRTGEARWRVDRDEITSWSTPLVVESGGRAQVVTSATNRVRSYDLETGRLLWESEGVTLNAIPSPVAGDGLVFVTSGYRGNRLLAVRLDVAEGDITDGAAVAWTLDRDTPYVPSPLLHDGVLYLLKSNSGLLSAFDATTGERFYGPERLPAVRSVYASPVGVGDTIYIPSREGRTVVVRAGRNFEVLASNDLDDAFDASPALAGDDLFLRGRRYLYCIGPPV